MPDHHIKRCIKFYTAMLTSTVLAPEDYARFAAFNQRNNGATVDPAYLQQVRLRVFYRTDNPNRWVAGYAVNAQPPFRYLRVLTPDVRTETLRQHGLRETDLVEITLLSRDRSLTWTPGERLFYYVMSLVDALRTGRRVVLGGTVEENHRRTQMEILDKLLYAGELNLSGHRHYGWLYYANRWRVIGNLIRCGSRRLRTHPKPTCHNVIARPTRLLPNNQ